MLGGKSVVCWRRLELSVPGLNCMHFIILRIMEMNGAGQLLPTHYVLRCSNQAPYSSMNISHLLPAWGGGQPVFISTGTVNEACSIGLLSHQGLLGLLLWFFQCTLCPLVAMFSHDPRGIQPNPCKQVVGELPCTSQFLCPKHYLVWISVFFSSSRSLSMPGSSVLTSWEMQQTQTLVPSHSCRVWNEVVITEDPSQWVWHGLRRQEDLGFRPSIGTRH